MSTCKVEMVQASRCNRTSKEIFTMICEYPRAIHAQLLTHGVFSKNSSSTRAIPLKTAIAQIRESPSKVIWTTNQSGMQGAVIIDPKEIARLDGMHLGAMDAAIDRVEMFETVGVHKQNAGRYLEPFSNIKIVLTSTEWENWDWLRIHKDAQGEIAELAQAMKEARDNADIMEIGEGEWHVPFVTRERNPNNTLGYRIGCKRINAEEARQVSMSVCAQTSYRKADSSLEKAIAMEGMLVNGHKVHASPFEHQATPIPEFECIVPCEWPKGVTHMRRDGTFGSGNFVGWIQHRQLIKNHDGANLHD